MKETTKLIIWEIASVTAVFLTALLTCLRVDRTDTEQIWIVSIMVLGGIAVIVGLYFGVDSFGRPDRMNADPQGEGGIIDIFQATMIGIVSSFCFGIFISLEFIGGYIFLWIVLVLFKAITGIDIYAFLSNFYPATIAAIAIPIAIYELVIPLYSFVTNITLFITGLITLIILYGVPQLI